LHCEADTIQALAKSFGVPTVILRNIKLPTAVVGNQGLGFGLAFGRGSAAQEAEPRDPTKWFRVSMPEEILDGTRVTNSRVGLLSSLFVWLPKDRKMVQNVVEVYFTRLNINRPVLLRDHFEQTLQALYDGNIFPDDSGYICSLYLILALGTLSELSHQATKPCDNTTISPSVSGNMPADWPAPSEFFERAMFVEPYIGVTMSSLQALILLHWYLYTEVRSYVFA
jgi:hypothetical protein